MVILSEVDALFNLISKATDLLQGVRRRYFQPRNSQQATQFADGVEELRRKQSYWNDLLRKHGHEAQKLVRPALESAMEILEREDRVIQKRQGSLWYKCFEATLNVEEASDAIQIVVQAFERVPRTLRDYNEANQILNEATFSPAVLPFRSDEKYVPLPKPLEAVQRALESVDGSPVVILYGQPGSGKTSLAKYLALNYDEIRRQQHQWGMTTGARGSKNLLCGRGILPGLRTTCYK